MTEHNILNFFRDNNIIEKFNKEIYGYHLINETPIKESVWEEINKNIVSIKCKVYDEACGNHLSGKDNRFNNWNISNKTGKISNYNNIKLSSYRLTSVCNQKEPGNIEEIKNEIYKRDKNFEYYSLLLRDENKNIIKYFWFLIPKEHYIFKIDNQWFQKIGQKGKNKYKQIGWISKNMSIEFNMSSQLWFNFNFNDINEYLISTTQINKNNIKKLCYSDIIDLIIKNNINLKQ